MKDIKYVMAQMENGENVGIEIITPNRSRETEISGYRDKRSNKNFSTPKIMNILSQFAQDLCSKLKKSHASKVEVEFGINFDINTGDVLSLIISESTEATMKVKLIWENNDV